MSRDLAVFSRGRIPWCDQCNKKVDSFQWETPVDTIYDAATGGARFIHTGEIIVTVECHGEKWKASNWRGRLPC